MREAHAQPKWPKVPTSVVMFFILASHFVASSAAADMTPMDWDWGGPVVYEKEAVEKPDAGVSAADAGSSDAGEGQVDEGDEDAGLNAASRDNDAGASIEVEESSKDEPSPSEDTENQESSRMVAVVSLLLGIVLAVAAGRRREG